MTGKLTIGLPSKGRLQENAFDFFAHAGMKVEKDGGRGYRGRLGGVGNVDIAFLSASEIAASLESGVIHFGVTGEDLIREQIVAPENAVELLVPLGFGQANVIVAVPQSWIDVRTMADLDDVALSFHSRHGRRLRVATKYLNLTRNFFASHGISDYLIVESLGATEGAPAAGSAEVIVDITSTGATLAANDLKILDDGTMLKSQANLVASLKANWCADAQAAAKDMLARIGARMLARNVTELRFAWNGGDDALLDRLINNLDCEIPNPPNLDETREGAEIFVQCPTARVADAVALLHTQGKDAVSATQADYIFRARNELFERLKHRIAGT